MVYEYGNFEILIQSETFSWTPYPIQIRNRSINCTSANIVYFASSGKNCGYFASCQTKVVDVVTYQVGYDTQKTRARFKTEVSVRFSLQFTHFRQEQVTNIIQISIWSQA